MPTCPNCGNQAAENAVFCDQCGSRLPAPEPQPQPAAAIESVAGGRIPMHGVPEGVLICPDCGAENVPGELFCDVCGNPLEAPAPVSEPAVVEAVAEPAIEPALEAEAVVAEVVEAEAVAAPTQAQELYCPTCGAHIGAGEAFCGNCGAAVGAPPVEAEVAPVEPLLDEAAAEELPVEEAPVEEWVPEEIVIEEIVVEEVAVEGAPAEVVAEAVLAEPVEPEVIPPEPAPVAAPAVPPEAAPLPGPVPVVEVATGPYLEIVDSGARIPLVEHPTSLMGRVDEVSGIYPDVDLTPHGGEEGGVSRRHAELQYEAGVWFVVDLDSTNGTFLNGSGLQPKVRVPLNDGDRLALGELEIVFHA
jgi:hypothetical protein